MDIRSCLVELLHLEQVGVEGVLHGRDEPHVDVLEDEDDLLHLQTRGGAARREEAQEVAAVKNEKARLDTLHLSAAHVQPRPLA